MPITRETRQLHLPAVPATLPGWGEGSGRNEAEGHPPSGSALPSDGPRGLNPPTQNGGVKRSLRRKTPTQVLATSMLHVLERLAGEDAVGVGMTDFYADVKPLLEAYARGSTKAT